MTSASVDLAKIDTGQIPRIPRVRSSQRRRNIELGLLVIASVLSAIAVGLVLMATMGAVHGGIFALAAIIVAKSIRDAERSQMRPQIAPISQIRKRLCLRLFICAICEICG